MLSMMWCDDRLVLSWGKLCPEGNIFKLSFGIIGITVRFGRG